MLNHGRWHHQNWGAAEDSLSGSFTPAHSGSHLVQLVYGNGSGPINTGIACAVKWVELRQSGNVVAEGAVVMPQLGSWTEWRDSSFLRATLDAALPVEIWIGENQHSHNMSVLEHFATYNGTGGQNGRSNYVNISAVKLLALED